MKVKVKVSNNSSWHAADSGWMDVEELGYTAEEWSVLNEDQKHKAALHYAYESMNLEVWHEETEEEDPED